jgi:predicted permease
MDFSTTAINVLMLVAMALPGFLLVKAKIVKQGALKPFSALLLYVCQPFLCIRSFITVEYTPEIAINIAIAFAISLVAQMLVLGVIFLVLRKRYDRPEDSAMLLSAGYIGGHTFTKEPQLQTLITSTIRGRAYRAFTLTSTFGNVGFFGIPVLEVLFPEHPEAIMYSAVYIVGMNLLAWTFGAYVLTGDRKYIRAKAAIINPQTVTLLVALPLFFAGVSAAKLPDQFTRIIYYLADMTAPLCMIILGMRFAFAPLKDLFTNPLSYVASAIKLLAFPLLVYVILLPFEMNAIMRTTLVLLSGMPSAVISLNLSELYGADQKSIANTILLSTLLCILTVPLLMMLP